MGSSAKPPAAPPPAPVPKSADSLEGGNALVNDLRKRRNSYRNSFLAGETGTTTGTTGTGGSSYLG
jgi:hypothetical protein